MVRAPNGQTSLRCSPARLPLTVIRRFRTNRHKLFLHLLARAAPPHKSVAPPRVTRLPYDVPPIRHFVLLQLEPDLDTVALGKALAPIAAWTPHCPACCTSACTSCCPSPLSQQLAPHVHYLTLARPNSNADSKQLCAVGQQWGALPATVPELVWANVGMVVQQYRTRAGRSAAKATVRHVLGRGGQSIGTGAKRQWSMYRTKKEARLVVCVITHHLTRMTMIRSALMREPLARSQHGMLGLQRHRSHTQPADRSDLNRNVGSGRVAGG